MSANDDLLEILKEALERAGDVSGRRMFGGIGVYFDATFFALIDDGAIYFKTSDATRAMFEAEGSRPFSYMTKKGLAELRSYWRLPERLLDETDELQDWARASVAAAREASRAKAGKSPAKRSKAKALPKAKSTAR
ncbi:TfoX/Sxy family protein [Hyphomicrobium sp.]|jgi:DNA transformation protein|uniref:TfoX/Sxy family protein n=1 Tax=Hyphomicrobium sp. TaxID=82 RepID=UPI0035632F11